MAKIGVAFARMVSYLPFWILFAFSDLLCFVIRNVFGYRRKVILSNLTRSFPDKSEEEINKIANEFYRRFADTIICSIKGFTISRKSMLKRFVIKNPEIFQEHLDAGRSIMAITGHYSNWEWIFSSPMHFAKDISSILIYQPLRNEAVNAELLKSRERFGVSFVPTYEAKSLIKGYPNDGKSIFGMVVDQSPRKNRIKHWIPFLNQTTAVHTGWEDLAREMNYAVVFVHVEQERRGHYTMHLKNIADEAGKYEEVELTKTFFKELERVIIDSPANWLWSHKRWKHQPEQ